MWELTIMSSRFKKYDLEEQLKALGVEIDQLTKEIENRAKQGMRLLQQQIYGKIVEKVQEKLKSTRHIYLANLGMLNETDNLYVVYLKKEAAWIEDGIEPHEMIDNLTRGPKSKQAQDGSRYNIIPFKHNKTPQHTSRAQMQIQRVVKQELKKRGLDKPIMVDGRPQLGRVVTLKTELASKGMPVNKFDKPILAGLTIYQKAVKTTTGKTKIQRDVMTFRVVSTKQKGSGMWYHPGLSAANFFQEVEKEVDVMWNEMLKDIVSNVKVQQVPDSGTPQGV